MMIIASAATAPHPRECGFIANRISSAFAHDTGKALSHDFGPFGRLELVADQHVLGTTAEARTEPLGRFGPFQGVEASPKSP
jgi:hypothetical protein